MCGIVGYIGKNNPVDFLYDGLSRLEYRGYDSAGIAVLKDKKIGVVKAEGKLSQLQPRLSELPPNPVSGIGHTRWATHGIPNTVNAHPHSFDNVALVHNGIIENYQELKKELIADGAIFQSQTDTEVVVHLYYRELKKVKDPFQAIIAMIPKLKGAFSLGIMVSDQPNTLYAVKLGSPLVIGAGKGECFFASDAMALVKHVGRAHFLSDGEIAKVTADGFEITNFNGQKLPTKLIELDISSASTEKQGFKHFMLKEIHEQPRVMSAMIRRFVDLDKSVFNDKEMGIESLDVSQIDHVYMVACGTAYYSALVGKYVLEPALGVPVSVELASEFRYREPWLSKKALFIAVSQSGETADTLASVKHAKGHGLKVLAICNVKMSSIVRESDYNLHMDAGPEIGVASTKAFTAMVLAMRLLSLSLGKRRGFVKKEELAKAIDGLRALPAFMDHAVDSKGGVEALAGRYYEASNFIFIGRGTSFGIALEGALKLKEISYIHAEGYAGGELKHGPIALIDRHMPVVAVVPKDQYHEKMISNVEEVRAREGRIIGVGDAHDDKLQGVSNDFIPCPQVDDLALQAILSVVPLQLLSYYIAVKRGTDVDQPRNLAKSVTVE